MPLRALARSALFALLASALSCAGAGDGEGPACAAGKCDDSADDLDDPTDEDFCYARRADALDPNQHAFEPEAIRWACADVPSIDGDARGQEYCEYFAIAGPPVTGKGAEPVILGLPQGDHPSEGVGPVKLELDGDQIEALEAAGDQMVAQCVFTSWFAPEPPEEDSAPASLAAAAPRDAPSIFGVPVTEELFRMRFAVNAREFGRDLFRNCMVLDCEGSEEETCQAPQVGDLDDITDPLHDDFLRACDLNTRVNDSAFRRSDNAVCAAALRMAECGCYHESGADIPTTLIPDDMRGLPLGTWAGATSLPPGCDYVDTGDGSRTVVACRLGGLDLLRGASDVKRLCRELYADDVVVHVPLPADELACGMETDSVYGRFCSEQPWILPAEE